MIEKDVNTFGNTNPGQFFGPDQLKIHPLLCCPHWLYMFVPTYALFLRDQELDRTLGEG